MVDRCGSGRAAPRSFTDEVSRFYAAEVVLAWEYIHTRNIIYRDLKPENLLISADGHLKVRARVASTSAASHAAPPVRVR